MTKIETDIEIVFQDIGSPTFVGFPGGVEVDVEIQLMDVFSLTGWKTIPENNLDLAENYTPELQTIDRRWGHFKWDRATWG